MSDPRTDELADLSATATSGRGKVVRRINRKPLIVVLAVILVTLLVFAYSAMQRAAGVTMPRLPVLAAGIAYPVAVPKVFRCLPLYVCDLRLPAEEKINSVAVGDPDRWHVTQAVSGSGQATVAHILITPSPTSEATSLVVATDQHAYALRLDRSVVDDGIAVYLPDFGVVYPEPGSDSVNEVPAEEDQQQDAITHPIIATQELTP